MEKALDIWNDLKVRYSQGNLSRVSNLQFKAASLNQGDLSVIDYFTKLRIIWDELENFRPNPLCIHQDTCIVAPIICQRKCEDQAMQFLRGLNDQYHNIRSHVLLMDPVPPITKIFSLVVQQELASSYPISNINSANTKLVNTFVVCTFCGKFGHSENTCFRKIGFPSQDNRTLKNSGNRKHCTYCNRSGHTIESCYKKHGYPAGYRFYGNGQNNQANNMIVAAADDSFSEHCAKEQEHKDSPFTAQQYQILSEMFKQNGNSAAAQINQVGSFSADPNHKAFEQSSTGNTILNSAIKNENFWILDSRATDHVCTVLSAFTAYRKIKLILINLPNGNHVYAEYSGTVTFNKKFFLKDVLYVPQFSFNLICTSKLCLHLNCHLIFFSTHCIIQDIITQEKIGLVSAKVGLYMFNSAIFPFSATLNTVPSVHNISKDFNLWHYRLGHLSDERIRVLRTQYPFISSEKIHLCDICNRAKQKKLPFTLST